MRVVAVLEVARVERQPGRVPQALTGRAWGVRVFVDVGPDVRAPEDGRTAQVLPEDRLAQPEGGLVGDRLALAAQAPIGWIAAEPPPAALATRQVDHPQRREADGELVVDQPQQVPCVVRLGLVPGQAGVDVFPYARDGVGLDDLDLVGGHSRHLEPILDESVVGQIVARAELAVRARIGPAPDLEVEAGRRGVVTLLVVGIDPHRKLRAALRDVDQHQPRTAPAVVVHGVGVGRPDLGLVRQAERHRDDLSVEEILHAGGVQRDDRLHLLGGVEGERAGGAIEAVAVEPAARPGEQLRGARVVLGLAVAEELLSDPAIGRPRGEKSERDDR